MRNAGVLAPAVMNWAKLLPRVLGVRLKPGGASLVAPLVHLSAWHSLELLCHFSLLGKGRESQGRSFVSHKTLAELSQGLLAQGCIRSVSLCAQTCWDNVDVCHHSKALCLAGISRSVVLLEVRLERSG